MFQELLKKEREKQGLSYEALGRKASCTGQTVRHYEHHKREPTLQIADKLLKALGVSMNIGEK